MRTNFGFSIAELRLFSGWALSICNRKSQIANFILLCLCVVCFASKAEEDVVTLKDGRKVTGIITQMDGPNVLIKNAAGEARAIPKSDITQIEKHLSTKEAAAMNAPASPVTGHPAPESTTPRKILDTETARALFAELKELGSPQPARRAAALEKALKDKAEGVPVLLAMLHPKQPTDEYTRIGVLRALSCLGPLPDDAARTLAYCAVQDSHPEARREACRTIRLLNEDRSIRELLRYAGSEGGYRNAAAAALREVDDPRAYTALIRAIPSPSVTANLGEGAGIAEPKYILPTGPGGLSMPIYLPNQPVSGVATDVGSPITDLLKLIAGKDLGNLSYAWINWYREKVGDIGSEERNSARDKRSLRDRIGDPYAH